ncbi:MAG: hypothetical protein IPL16_12940 [Ignavibacteria bacterium]|nr:hypothetical protein [Ignavibacteria bacterium]
MEIRINYVEEVSKIKNKLIALCIRLYKTDKENQRLIFHDIVRGAGRGKGRKRSCCGGREGREGRKGRKEGN